jgi:GTP cyclohydrolase I
MKGNVGSDISDEAASNESNLENGTSDNKVEEISKLMKDVLRILNPNLKNDIISKTPARFAKALIEFTNGYDDDLDSIVSDAIFDNEDYNDIIKIKNINFSSLCEHHLLPFHGECSIGYIPNKLIMGLSKFSRIVQSLSKKLHLQERLTREIAESVFRILQPLGVVVEMNAVHSCMCFRGIKSYNAGTSSIYTIGLMKEKDNLNKYFKMK